MARGVVTATRDYIAVCTAGCTIVEGDDHTARPLEEAELAPHDDKHLSSRARVLVRMLRDASPEIRNEVLEYCTGDIPRFARRY